MAPRRTSAASAPANDSRDRHRAILETAARVICERGYEGASIQDIADACGLTKAGLYHHIRSKEHLLLEIMNYGMDVFEEQVLSQVLGIADPLERLRTCMEKNVLLVTRGWSKEVTIILHEHATLTGEARAQINARKKRYVRFLETSFTEALRAGRIRPIHPKVAAFAFLGMVLWIYKWFRPEGPIPEAQLVREMDNLFFGGLQLAGTQATRRAAGVGKAPLPETAASRDEAGAKALPPPPPAPSSAISPRGKPQPAPHPAQAIATEPRGKPQPAPSIAISPRGKQSSAINLRGKPQPAPSSSISPRGKR